MIYDDTLFLLIDIVSVTCTGAVSVAYTGWYSGVAVFSGSSSSGGRRVMPYDMEDDFYYGRRAVFNSVCSAA